MLGYPGLQKAVCCLMWKRKAAQNLGTGAFITILLGSCQFKCLGKVETSVS